MARLVGTPLVGARTAVIGAGMAGLACAAGLAERGASVTLFDKGRRPGGRVATRRTGAWQFDHGAQYLTARDAGFIELMEQMAADGTVALWPAAGPGCWVGRPGMSALPRWLAARLAAPPLLERHVAYLRYAPDGWHVSHVDAATVPPGTVMPAGGEQAGPFDAVLLALPAPQAALLLAAVGHDFADRLARVVMAPCWALMAAFAAPVAAPDCQRPEDGPLAWVARDSARPDHARLPECWVAHATPNWSRARLERPAEEVAVALLAAFRAVTGAFAAPEHVAAHRWRHALTEVALGEVCLWDPAARLGVCGDWCLGARVEAAWRSGHALAALVSAEGRGFAPDPSRGQSSPAPLGI